MKDSKMWRCTYGICIISQTQNYHWPDIYSFPRHSHYRIVNEAQNFPPNFSVRTTDITLPGNKLRRTKWAKRISTHSSHYGNLKPLHNVHTAFESSIPTDQLHTITVV